MSEFITGLNSLLALFLIAYLTLPAVSRPINRAAAVLGSANVDAVVEYFR